MIPGNLFRKTVFWLHLGAGVTTGIVVAMMSFTGVLLTYEHQVLDWADRAYYRAPGAGESRISAEAIVAAAASADIRATELVYRANADAPVAASAGRRGGSVYVDPYGGEVLGPPSPGAREFFRAVTGWHRRFNVSGDSSDTARLITGVSNLAFLFLILTGVYLWLPRIVRWPLIRARLFFAGRYPNSQLRDFHWHHVFGIWSAIPLAVVVATAAVFSFSWANDLVYTIAGDDAAARVESPSASAAAPAPGPGAAKPSLDELLAKASAHVDGWRSITMNLPEEGSSQVAFRIDSGSGRQPQHSAQLSLDAATGDVVSWEPFSERAAGRRARQFIRFLHTGEVFGVVGQTIAGAVSLASLFMVWTGMCLAWRRLVSPLFGR
jgi:uncharacterized iron-regulated membrane protein